jgi:Family of unknown function (DUF6166)
MRIEGSIGDGFGTSNAVVKIDGRPLSPRRSLKVRNHSPTGFAWGYAGSGPAQLALAVLLEAGVPKEKAETLHQAFKSEYIAALPQGDFKLDVDVAEWAARKLEQRARREAEA